MITDFSTTHCLKPVTPPYKQYLKLNLMLIKNKSLSISKFDSVYFLLTQTTCKG